MADSSGLRRRYPRKGEHMTTIHFYCQLRRAYVSMQVPTEAAFKLAGLT